MRIRIYVFAFVALKRRFCSELVTFNSLSIRSAMPFMNSVLMATCCTI